MDLYKEYIYDHVNDLQLTNKKELIRLLVKDGFDISTVSEKGSGCQLNFSHIKEDKIKEMYDFIKNIIENSYTV